MAPMASRPTRDYMHIASSLGKLKDRLRFSGTLRVRLTAAFTLLIVATTFVVVALLARYSAGVQLEAQYRAGESLLRVLALALESGTVRAPPEIERLLRAAAGDPAVAGLRLRDGRDARVYEYARDDAAPAWYTRALAPRGDAARTLQATAGRTGAPLALELTLANAPLNAAIRNTLVEGAAATFALLLLALLFAYLLLHRFTAPLKPLTEWAREFSRGNWTPRIELMP